MGTRRQQIIIGLVDVIKGLDGTFGLNSDLNGNVFPRMMFWDEVVNYPTVTVCSGTERREYQSGGLSWGYLDVKITIYVEAEDPKDELETLFADIESIIDANNSLIINNQSLCTDIRLSFLSDDEGVLAPLGIGEMEYTVQYNV
jgi:hypothetical protein